MFEVWIGESGESGITCKTEVSVPCKRHFDVKNKTKAQRRHRGYAPGSPTDLPNTWTQRCLPRRLWRVAPLRRRHLTLLKRQSPPRHLLWLQLRRTPEWRPATGTVADPTRTKPVSATPEATREEVSVPPTAPSAPQVVNVATVVSQAEADAKLPERPDGNPAVLRPLTVTKRQAENGWAYLDIEFAILNDSTTRPDWWTLTGFEQLMIATSEGYTYLVGTGSGDSVELSTYLPLAPGFQMRGVACGGASGDSVNRIRVRVADQSSGYTLLARGANGRFIGDLRGQVPVSEQRVDLGTAFSYGFPSVRPPIEEMPVRHYPPGSWVRFGDARLTVSSYIPRGKQSSHKL